MKLNSSNSSPYLAIEDSELLFKLAFNQQLQFMAILSPEGRVLDVNAFFLDSQSGTREDHVGKFLWATPAWSNLPEWEDIWKQRLVVASKQKMPVLTEDIFHADDGAVHYADASTSAIFDPNNGLLVGYLLQANDTTKNRFIKNKVKKNEARLERILSHSHIGYWELNLIDHTSHRSLMHDQIFGYHTLLAEWSYERFLEHVIPDDRADVDHKFKQAIENKSDWNFECQILRKDGVIRWILASGRQEFDPMGNVNFMTGLVQDITECKQAEIAKLLHNAELQGLFDALPDIYFRMMQDGTIVDYHAQNRNKLYRDPETFIGKPMQVVLPKEIGTIFQSKIDEIARVEEPLVFTYELLVNNETLHFSACLNKIAINDQLICVIRDVTDEVKSKQSLALSEQRFRTIFEQAPIGVALVQPDSGEFIRINQQFCDMLGYSIEEMSNGKTFKDITHPDDLQLSFNYIDKLHDLTPVDKLLRKRYFHKKGHIVWVELSISPTQNTNELSHPIIVTAQDIGERKKVEERLSLAANVFTHAAEGIMITDATGHIVDVNDVFVATTGYSREEAIGQNPSFLQSGHHPADFYADMWRELAEKGIWSGEVWNNRKDNKRYAEMLNISSVKDTNGNITNYVGLFTDITLMKEHQAQLEHSANYDLLTNLPNRSLLADRLSQAMLQCGRRQQSLAVVFLDLDGFKAVNDTYGHDVGDDLLIALSVRIKGALREGDTLARIGGDEFVAVLADLSGVEDCKKVLERFLIATSDPITIGNVVLNVSSSIGVTLTHRTTWMLICSCAMPTKRCMSRKSRGRTVIIYLIRFKMMR